MTTPDGAQSTVTLRSAQLTADVAGQGAELVRLRDAEGRDLLWDADPAVWAWHAPLLFPIVGRVANDEIRVDGVSYPLKQHGLARRSAFELVHAALDTAHFRLRSSPQSLAAFPFPFVLDVVYRLAGAALTIEAVVTNAGGEAMPVSFGFHPAFRWPLPYGQVCEDHAIVFERDETAGTRRLIDGLIEEAIHPSPVADKRLALRDDLFAADALIFDRPESRSVVYGGPSGPSIRVSFPGMPHLGVWSKPGAGFVCIEPWQGFASPKGFEGELKDKPGMVSVAPDAQARFAIRIELQSGPA